MPDGMFPMIPLRPPQHEPPRQRRTSVLRILIRPLSSLVRGVWWVLSSAPVRRTVGWLVAALIAVLPLIIAACMVPGSGTESPATRSHDVRREWRWSRDESSWQDVFRFRNDSGKPDYVKIALVMVGAITVCGFFRLWLSHRRKLAELRHAAELERRPDQWPGTGNRFG